MGLLSAIFRKHTNKESVDDVLVENIRHKLKHYKKTEGKASFSGPKVVGVEAQVEVIETLDGNEAIEFYKDNC